MDLKVTNCKNGIILNTPEGDYVFNRSADLAAYFASKFSLDGNSQFSLVNIILVRVENKEKNQIPVIKEIRSLFGSTLKDAKEQVDIALAGGLAVLARGVQREQAWKARKLLEEAGAVVTLVDSTE